MCAPLLEDDANKRKRQMQTEDIASMSEVVTLWQPGTAGGQAARAIKERSSTTTEAQLPSLFRAYQQDDPAGTYIIESNCCIWNQSLNQFVRDYASMSIYKLFWENTV
jgi:hypothetical protein